MTSFRVCVCGGNRKMLARKERDEEKKKKELENMKKKTERMKQRPV